VTDARRARSLLESFNFAFEGIIHTLRTQRNLRLHFLIAVAVIFAAVAFDVTRIELIALLISISFVLVAEMINSAIEAAVDVASEALSGRGRPLRGGLPSGHAAVAFAGWMVATLVLHDSGHRFLISSLTFIMALLVAQTRVEAGVHSAVEVGAGALLGSLVTLGLFQLFFPG